MEIPASKEMLIISYHQKRIQRSRNSKYSKLQKQTEHVDAKHMHMLGITSLTCVMMRGVAISFIDGAVMMENLK